MYTVLMVVQLLVGISLIALVLIQHGKGADAGAAFGSGASGTVFGARGAANFLSRSTAWLAAVFFIVSLALAYLVHNTTGGERSLADQLDSAPLSESVPANSDASVAPADEAVPGEAPEPQAPAVPE